MPQQNVNYKDVELTVEYEGMVSSDYGVTGSPAWGDAEIQSVFVGGIEITSMLNDDQLCQISELIEE